MQYLKYKVRFQSGYYIEFYKSLQLFSAIFFITLFIAQCAIDPSQENIICAGVACLSTILALIYFLRERIILHYYLSGLSVAGLALAGCGVALIGTTIGLKPIIYNLDVPLITFSVSSLIVLVAIAVHLAYRKFALSANARHFLRQKVYSPLGFFRAPTDIELWIGGLAGLLALFSSGTAASDVEFGDAWGKLLQGMAWLIITPFLTPFRSVLFGEKPSGNFLKWVSLSVYFLIILAAAISENSRGTFSEIILTIALLIFTLFITRRVKWGWKSAVIIIILSIFAIPAYTFLGNISTAMLINRADRATLNTGELIQRTIDTSQDKDEIKRWDENSQILKGGYNEVYMDSEFLKRFSATKYIDLNFYHIGNIPNIDPSLKSGAIHNNKNRLISLLPTPVISLLGINIDKNSLLYSSGDYYAFYASRGPLGSYVTGSSIADGYVVMGFLYIPFFAFMCFLFFTIFDSLLRINAGMSLITPFAAIFIQAIFFRYLSTESVAAFLSGILRTIPQSLLIYCIFFFTTNILFNKVGGFFFRGPRGKKFVRVRRRPSRPTTL